MQHPAVTSCLRFKSLSYTFTFSVKTGKPLLLLLFYFACLNHLTAITITAASLLIYRCGWEWRLNCQSLIDILVFPSCRTINLVILPNEDFSDPLHLWASRRFLAPLPGSLALLVRQLVIIYLLLLLVPNHGKGKDYSEGSEAFNYSQRYGFAK